MLTQLSVFVENKFGRLAAITDILKANDVDISALSLADTSDFGILRLIVDKPELAKEVLREAGIMVKSNHVIAAAMDDKPGGLAYLLRLLTDAHVSIEYMYAFMGKEDDKAFTVIRADDNEKAAKVFADHGVKMLEQITDQI